MTEDKLFDLLKYSLSSQLDVIEIKLRLPSSHLLGRGEAVADRAARIWRLIHAPGGPGVAALEQAIIKELGLTQTHLPAAAHVQQPEGTRVDQGDTAFPPSSPQLESTTDKEERRFMEMAIEEARKSVGEDDRAHPKVGAVVVKDGAAVATAFRGELGKGEHAEYTVLEKKLPDENLAGATIYSTLEPCTSRKHPKTPCAQRLIDRKITRVVFGMLDPNPRICGKGERLLRDLGIEVERFPHELIMKLEEMNRAFTNAQSQVDVARPKSPPQHAADPLMQPPIITFTRKSRVVPAKAQGSQLWRNSLQRAQARFARASEQGHRLGCVLIQSIVPTFPRIEDLPQTSLSQGQKPVATGGGLGKEPRQLFNEDKSPMIAERPIVDANGNPMLFSSGEPIAMDPGVTRMTQFYGDTPANEAYATIAADAAKCIDGLPVDLSLVLWKDWRDGFDRPDDRCLWTNALFELAWQAPAGTPLLAYKFAWSKASSVRLDELPRLRKTLSKVLRDIPDPPVHFYSTIEDLFQASVSAIDVLLASSTGENPCGGDATKSKSVAGFQPSLPEDPTSNQRLSSIPAVHIKKPRPDVLLVTVNEHETRAVHAEFEAATGVQASTVSLDSRVYRNLGMLNGTTVFHALSEMGSSSVGSMQQTVDKAIRALDPGAVIAVGMAFGVNEKKQAIGDILLSKQLRPYDVQRVGNEIILRDDKPHASSRLINYFQGFAQTAWKGKKVQPGVILTGGKLIDDIDYRSQLLAMETEAVGGEMEGAGLYVSCQEHKVDWIVVKAICDWADGQKSKNKTARQKKAAKSAARFMIQALQHAALKRPS